MSAPLFEPTRKLQQPLLGSIVSPRCTAFTDKTEHDHYIRNLDTANLVHGRLERRGGTTVETPLSSGYAAVEDVHRSISAKDQMVRDFTLKR